MLKRVYMMRNRSYRLAILLALIPTVYACNPAQTSPANITVNNRTRRQNFKPFVEFRVQQVGTEGQFQAQNQVLQKLLVEQNKLQGTSDRVALKKNQAALKQVYRQISSLFSSAKLDDRDITSAAQQPINNVWSISVTFSKEGANKFAQITKELAGTGRSFGIFYQGKLISAPLVDAQFHKNGITGGTGVIQGNFTAKESYELASKLNEASEALIDPAVKQYQSFVKAGKDKLYSKDFNGAIKGADKAIKLNPQGADAYLIRGMSKAGLQKWKDAIADYRQVLKIDPKSIYGYIYMARAKEALQDYNGAINDYNYLKKVNPDSAYLANPPLLQNYLLLGKKTETLDLIDEFATDNLEKNLLKGKILIQFEDYKAAITYLDKAIAIKPNRTKSYLYRGIAYNKLGARQSAIKDWQKVVSIKPEDNLPQEFRDQPLEESLLKSTYEDLLHQAYFSRGAAYYYLENWKAAKLDLDKAISIRPNSSNAYEYRSLTRQKLKDAVGAKQDADKAAELSKNAAEPILLF